MRKNSKVLGCCGVVGITNVDEIFQEDVWNRNDVAFEKEVERFKRLILPKFRRNRFGNFVIDFAAVQFNLADWQTDAIKFFDTLPFIKVELGRNPNTGAVIYTYFAPRQKWKELLDQWEEDIKQANKPVIVNPFIGAR